MANYLTEAVLLDAVGESELKARTDRKNTGIIDQSIIDQKVADAENEVDGYLRGGGYTLPLAAPVDPTVISQAIAVFRWHLWLGARFPEEVETRYKYALGRLKDIAASRITLKLAETDTPQSLSIGIDAPDKVFTDEALSGY